MIGKRTSPLCKCGNIIQKPEHVFNNCALYAENRPDEWSGGVSMENVRHYLINTMRVLWSEQKGEEKSGANRVRKNRRQRKTAGVPITGTGPVITSRQDLVIGVFAECNTSLL